MKNEIFQNFLTVIVLVKASDGEINCTWIKGLELRINIIVFPVELNTLSAHIFKKQPSASSSRAYDPVQEYQSLEFLPLWEEEHGLLLSICL